MVYKYLLLCDVCPKVLNTYVPVRKTNNCRQKIKSQLVWA